MFEWIDPFKEIEELREGLKLAIETCFNSKDYSDTELKRIKEVAAKFGVDFNP